MKQDLRDLISSDNHIPTRQFAEGFRRSLNSNCGRILESASNRWDRKFAGKEPSDACVSVRISGDARTTLDDFQSSRGPYRSLAA